MTNLLSNPDFLGVGIPTLLVAPAPVFVSGSAAAPSWTVASSSPGSTSTDILPCTRADGGELMMHVCTTGRSDNGVFQEFEPPEDLASVVTSVWVFVLRGKVGVGTGNAAATTPDEAQSTVIGQWELLRAVNRPGPRNTFVLYSVPDPWVADDLQQGACFYFEAPSVDSDAG